MLNIVTGDRYSVTPDEVIIYLMDEFGVPPAPVDEEVRDKVLSSPRGKQFTGWTRAQPSLNELREQYGGRSTSDEELLLRYMVPAEDIKAVRAAGPLRTDHDFTDVHSLPQLVAHLQGLQRTRSVSVSGPDYRFALQRDSARAATF